MSSRDLEEKEKSDLVQYVIARDAVVMIVHPSNKITSLSEEEIKGIYGGVYKNWKELGGDDRVIVVVTRDAASGTRTFFWEKVMKKGNITETALEKNSNGAVQQTVAQTPGAVGYVGLGYVDATVKGVKINKNREIIEPVLGNVMDGKYPLARNLYMLTKGEAKGAARDYLDFVTSLEGQKIAEKEGFVPL